MTTAHDDGSQYSSVSSDIQKAIEGLTQHAPAANQPSGKYPIHGLSPNNPKGSTRGQAKPAEEKHQWLPLANFIVQVVLCVATTGAFIAAGIYAFIAVDQRYAMEGQWSVMISQWDTMRDGLLETQMQTAQAIKSANAAQSAAVTAATELEIAQRAYLSIGQITSPLGGYGLVDIPVVNYGHTPCAWRKISITYERIKVPPPTAPKEAVGNFLTRTTLKEQTILRHQTITKADYSAIVPGPEGVYSLTINIPFMKLEDLKAVRDNLEYLKIDGSIEYDTGFQKSDKVAVCATYSLSKQVWVRCGSGGPEFQFTELPDQAGNNK